MPEARARRGPARHERPAIDDAALVAARHADRLVAAARDRGISRWADFLAPLPDRLRDDELGSLRLTALRARAAYGPRDSVRDALPGDLTEPFLDAIDKLLRELARREATERS
ncbi:MAG: hypothetical protein E6J17_02585 [Chloroflexi bacterium]|nr:MAG: hypothetical protein E6J17_02585 [Chloroflexota bacterium]